jgi:predicted  nucleic acid-binding Zn-ribbon protein
MSESKRILNWRFIFLLVIAAVLYLIFLHVPKPCQDPLTYRIGRVDERFGISRSEFSMAVGKAAAVWEKPLSRKLFREDPHGKIEINLIYDYRQETTDKLKQINSRMDDMKGVYANSKTCYESLKAEYERKRAAIENDFHDLNARIAAYNAEIESWNRRGGATETQHSRLMSEKNELDAVRESLSIRQDEVNSLADEVNSMALVTNEIAARQNLDVEHYREVGSRLDGEFQEGFFESKQGRQSITLYHFDNEAKLVRLLVHELGHALMLDHSDNPNAVMYRLNQGDAAELTEDDIAALRARCEGK